MSVFQTSSKTRAGSAPAWYESFPAPRSTTVYVPRPEVLALLTDEAKLAGRDYVLVDLRRNDYEGGTIRGSLNLPAQSLYWALPSLYQLVAKAGVETVIFYCGSSAGRGSRAASWLADHVKDQGGSVKSVALEGGIKAWAKAGAEYVACMEGYEEDVWDRTE